MGWQMNPMFGAAAMRLSSVCVVSNAFRLNLVKIYGKRTKNMKWVKRMTKTLKIDGILCSHCEESVKTALKEVANVESVTVSHKEGRAVVTFSKGIPDDILKRAVEDNGYSVTFIE